MIRAMDSSEISLPAGSGDADRPSGEAGAGAVSMSELGIRELRDYSLVIDARSPREYADDHLPGAVNLPVVDNDQFAEVGTRHKSDKHVAYLIGYRNRIAVMMGWAWQYFAFARGARLITGRAWEPAKPVASPPLASAPPTPSAPAGKSRS